jgi:hypothetical protein
MSAGRSGDDLEAVSAGIALRVRLLYFLDVETLIRP